MEGCCQLENENRHIACLGTCHPSVDVIVFEIEVLR